MENRIPCVHPTDIVAIRKYMRGRVKDKMRADEEKMLVVALEWFEGFMDIILTEIEVENASKMASYYGVKSEEN